LAVRGRQIKSLSSQNKHIIQCPMAIACTLSICSRRVRVYDPIAVSSPSQRLSELAADWIITPFPQPPLGSASRLRRPVITSRAIISEMLSPKPLSVNENSGENSGVFTVQSLNRIIQHFQYFPCFRDIKAVINRPGPRMSQGATSCLNWEYP
jgi:hypothetical protein